MIPLLRLLALSGATLPLCAQVSFGPPQEISDYVRNPEHVRISDIDQDGDQDVLVAEADSVRVLWWENDGTGQFANRHEWGWGGLYSEVVAIEDANGDGNLDLWIEDLAREEALAIGESRFRLLIAHGDGAGSFSAPTELINEVVSAGQRIEHTAELNGDNQLDFITNWTVFLSDGVGGYHAGQPFPSHGGSKIFVPADLDGDQDMDLILVDHHHPPMEVIWNLGGGAFSSPDTFLETNPALSSMGVVPIPGPGGSNPPTLITGFEEELDADTSRFWIAAYEADGTGAYHEIATLELPAIVDYWKFSDFRLHEDPYSRRIFLAKQAVYSWDLTRGLHMKLAELQWNGTSLSITELLETENGIRELSPMVANLDGDVFPDLVIPHTAIGFAITPFYDHLVWHAGDSAGAFEPEVRSISQPALERILHHAGDIDGDGDADLLTGGYEPWSASRFQRTVVYWENQDGNGSFEPTELFPDADWLDVLQVTDVVGTIPVPAGADPALGQISWPAGRLDLLVYTFESTSLGSTRGHSRVDWMLQADDGTFHRVPAIAVESILWEGTITHADWDADGTADLVLSQPSFTGAGFRDLWWRKGSDYEFGSLQMISLGIYSETELLDLDWDGDLDALASGYLFGSNSSYWFENDGTGGIASIRPLPGLINPLRADIDGDGRDDYSGTENNASAYLFAREGVAFESQPADWAHVPVEFLDLDGDGDLDELHSLPTDFTTGYQSLGWRENKGGGEFEPVEFAISGPVGPGYHPIAPPMWASRSSGQLADIDGDGVKDLVMCSGGHARLEWFKITRPPAPAVFSDWMNGHGLSGHSAAPAGDWDRDKRTNWEEFGFGSDPGLNDPAHPGIPHVVRDASGLHYSYDRRLDRSNVGLDYHDLQSSDLVNWQPWTPAPDIFPGPEGYERLRVTLDSQQAPAFFKTEIPVPTAPSE